MSPKRRQLILIGIGGVVLFIIIFVIVAIVASRPKEVDVSTAKVVIEVAPTDAKVTLNGKQVKTGEHIVDAPSTVTVKVERKGFFSQTRTAKVSSLETRYFGFVLSSNSSDTATYLADNANQSKVAGEISSKIFDQNSADVAYYNQLTRQLPYLGAGLDFRIDYAQHLGKQDSPANTIYFQISANNNQDRAKAVQWIRDQGLDPSVMEIEFSDFINPLIIEAGNAQ